MRSHLVVIPLLLAGLVAVPWAGVSSAEAQAPRSVVGIVVPTPYGPVAIDTPPAAAPARRGGDDRPQVRERERERERPAAEPRSRGTSDEPRRQARPAREPRSLGEPTLRRRKP